MFSFQDRLPPVVVVEVGVGGDGQGKDFRQHPSSSSSLRSQLEHHVGRMCPEQEVKDHRRAWIDGVVRSIDWRNGDGDGDVGGDPASKRRKPQQQFLTAGTTSETASASNATTTTSTVFSWMDTSLLASLVTWEEIQEAALASKESNPQEDTVLALLQRVVHLDDLLSDWPEVVKLVRDGLRHATSKPKSGQLSSSKVDLNYHSLAVKWLNLTRASTRSAVPSVQSIPAHLQSGEPKEKEGGNSSNSWGGVEASHWDVQTDLLYVLVVDVGAAASDYCGGDDYDFDDSDIVRHTWLDWMLRFGRSAARDARVRAIGSTLWNGAIADAVARKEEEDASPHASNSSFYHRTVLRLDPHARWFQAWVDLLDSADILELLQTSNQPTTVDDPPVTAVAHSTDIPGATTTTHPSTTAVPPLVSLVHHVQSLLTATEEPPPGNSAASTTMQAAAHSLCLLGAALMRLRVSHFPWELLQEKLDPSSTCEGNNDEYPATATTTERHTRDGVTALGDLYLQLLSQVLLRQPQQRSNVPQGTSDKHSDDSYSYDYSCSSDEWLDTTTLACYDALDVLLSGTIYRDGDAPIATVLLAKIRSLATSVSEQGRRSQRQRQRLLQLAELYESVA